MRIIPNPYVGSSTRNILFIALFAVSLTLIPSFTNAQPATAPATASPTAAPTTVAVATPPPPPPPVDSVAIPVDVGDIAEAKPQDKFGTFPVEFAMCGKSSSVALNVHLGAGKKRDINVHCVPEPGYVIVGEEDRTLDDMDGDSLLKQCNGIIACGSNVYQAGADSATQVWDHKTNKLNKYKLPVRTNSICGDKELTKTGKIFIANENNCMYSGKHETLLNAIKGSSVVAKFHILPRFIGKANQFNLGHNHVYRTEITAQAYDSQMVLGFQNEGEDANKEFKQCDGACSKGRTLKFAFTGGQWRAIVYLKETCPSFRICINPENVKVANEFVTCKPGAQWDVLVHAGAVVWPGLLGGSVIKMKHDFTTAEAADSGVVAVEIGYGVDVEGKIEAELFVGNVYREYVMSDSQGFKEGDASLISMHFPLDECLDSNGGVASANIKTGHTYVPKGETVEAKGGSQTAGVGIQGDQNQAGAHAFTTNPPPTPRAVTKMPPPPPPRRAEYASGVDVIAHPRDDIYDEGDWWTWGLYLGSIMGSAIVMLPGTALFYVLRRTVFATWYRGMYKRYGCDASGTTGGITGVGFSDTTTGGITVGGTTGGGTTGGGTTMGGDTTGGDTTKTNTLAL